MQCYLHKEMFLQHCGNNLRNVLSCFPIKKHFSEFVLNLQSSNLNPSHTFWDELEP